MDEDQDRILKFTYVVGGVLRNLPECSVSSIPTQREIFAAILRDLADMIDTQKFNPSTPEILAAFAKTKLALSEGPESEYPIIKPY